MTPQEFKLECLRLASLVLNGTLDDGRVVKLAREYYGFISGSSEDDLKEKS